MRASFQSEVAQLRDEILVLGSMVEQALLQAVEALKQRDVHASQRVLNMDLQINARRFAIENQVVVLIATQQPMARDLRLLAATLEIAGELERMGDYAKGIARVSLRLGHASLPKQLLDNIPSMAQRGVDMLHRALTAFVNEDVILARSIPSEDDEVDALYNQVYQDLMVFLVKNPGNIEHMNWLLWAAHNLERFADRVSNICERTIFYLTGEVVELNGSSSAAPKKQ